MKKIIVVNIVMIIIFIACFAFILSAFNSCMKEVGDVGLKNIVNEVWEGKQKQ